MRSALLRALVCGLLATLLFQLDTIAERPRTRAPGTRSSAMPSNVAPDIAERLAKWKPVEMPFDPGRFSARERRLVEKLIDACRDLENLFWRQSDPEDVALYDALARSSGERERRLARLLWIHAGRYDLLDENRPFLGAEPMPPGRAFYPKGMQRAEIDAYVDAHPDRRTAIYDERTVVRRSAGRLETVPYRVAYRRWLEPASRKLREAAVLSEDSSFARFLRLRADALLGDDYFESDVAWVRLENPKFDLIFAPYETYLDDLLGVKASYGAAVLVRNEQESARLAVFQGYVAEIQDSLPLAPGDRPSKRGGAAPMEVMDAPFRAGDLRHGYQAVADNLPNDPRVHREVGSKRIFFKNFMDGRVEHVILPLANRLLREDQAARVSAEGYFLGTLVHEIAHGLGPAFARKDGKEVDIREAIGPLYSGLEEAKADAVGMFCLAWLIDRGAIPRGRLEEYYASYVADFFRSVRFGTAEAHGRAEMMEFNYLSEQEAITREASGRYAVDMAKMTGAIAALAKELLETEATGDRSRAEAWFRKYDRMPPELASALRRASDIPVDLDPRVPFPEGVR